MKELKKRFRGLFVLLLAATFFLQGGWFTPVNAESSNEYLIILQNGYGSNPDQPAESTETMWWSAKNYGVYKGAAGTIASKINAGSIKKELTDTDIQGVSDLEKLSSISAIQEPEGATIYLLSTPSSGGILSVKDADGNNIPYYEKQSGSTDIEVTDEDASYTHYFYKIDTVRKVKSADLAIRPFPSREVYYRIDSGNWAKTSSAVTVPLLNDSTGAHAESEWNSSAAGYELVFDLYKPSIQYTVSDVNVKYDGKPHGITVTVTDPTSDYEIKYGTTEGKYDGTELPTFTEPGEYTVYYQINAGPNYDIATGSAKVIITKDEPVVTKYTITYDLDGGTLDGMTGTVTEKHPAGAVITLPAPTKEGYTFDHWEGSTYYAGDKYTVTGDHTFKAVWKTGAGGSGKKGSGTKTGDENALGAWIVLLLAAMAGTTGMVYARKRKGE